MPNPKCAVCDKTVYPMEAVVYQETHFHKPCFKCSEPECGFKLNLSTVNAVGAKIFCSKHKPTYKPTGAKNAPKVSVVSNEKRGVMERPAGFTVEGSSQNTRAKETHDNNAQVADMASSTAIFQRDFLALLEKETKNELSENQAKHQWMIENVNWPNVEKTYNLFSNIGYYLVPDSNVVKFLTVASSDLALEGPGIMTDGGLIMDINRFCNLLQFTTASFKMFPIASVQINVAGGVLRAGVLMVAANREREGGWRISTYCAAYEIKADNYSSWRGENMKTYLAHAKGWAIYTACTEYLENKNRVVAKITL